MNPTVYYEREIIETAEAEITDPQSIKELIYEKADKYGVSREKLYKTVKCENPPLDPLLQSYVIDKTGKREDSWGLSQWHLPSKNKTKDGIIITREMAQDPELALDTMAWYFSQGNARLWTCYRKLFMGKTIP